MPNKWEEIEYLRRRQVLGFSGLEPEQPIAVLQERIDELLGELAADGDVEAAVQRSLDAISRLLAAGQITNCEAFARAMQSIAAKVKREAGEFDVKMFLSVAHAYLVSEGEQDWFGSAGRMVLKHKRSHGYDAVVREARAPSHWTEEHSPSEGGPGSGWFPPVPGDTAVSEATSGKRDHFIVNAIAQYYGYDVIGPIGTAVVRSNIPEASPTDRKMNELGGEFGDYLRGGLVTPATPDDIADWIRSTLCTEDVWEGTLLTHVTVAGPGVTCTGTWQAKIKVFVRKDGTASGEISVVDAPVNSCGGTYAILDSHWPVTAAVNDAGFTFRLNQFVGEMVQESAFIQKSGRNQASGTATPQYSLGGGQNHSFVLQFELECKTCGP
jgi:hypothetical protein